MADLADRIATANKKKFVTGEDMYDLDEYDLPENWEDPEYIAARIIWRNLDEYNRGRADLLHTRNNRKELWIGQERLKKDKSTLYRLAAANKQIKDHLVPQIYEHIAYHAKYLDKSKILVNDMYYWDKDLGELRLIQEDMPAITST